MKRPKLSTPTYLMRKEAERDLFGVIKKLGSLGFDGLELGGLFGHEPEKVRRAAEASGLHIVMDHIAYADFERDADNIIASRAALGSNYISIAKIPADKYPGGANYGEGIRFIRSIAEKTKRAGMTLQYHNHGFDFSTKIDGKYPFELILDPIEGELLETTFDLGWCALGGGDVRYILDKYKDRCSVIHLKDYYADGPVIVNSADDLGGKPGGADKAHCEFRPTGYGIMDFPSLFEAFMACSPKWITTDHDASYCGRDCEELVMSREYVGNLLDLEGY